ncbi:PQQ-binding-like beta-propeller repeat protein [Micromonospora sp. ALFpr18c]|uniref:outer membrane protein assembly factor BamB family protein n=1 Tax=unclassified Micromonospora TaxID=2617518 RepID=UPI00124BC6BD|nr:PQQ-binding-like beta-propeller repeat protein [Micromonospora sp. ALFpr18c]KAB1929944.1 PQQ-binding-like beta-propeller repeat protein [Micromonospora sp. ALFpr18c]
MSIIELGEVHGDDASMAPAPRPPRAVGRPARSVAVLLLAAVVLAGAAPVPGRMVSPVPAARAAAAYLAEDGVFVVDPPTATGDRYLTAYAPPTADGGVRRRWQAPLPRTGDYLGVRVERGLVLVLGISAANGVFQTTAFAAETGRQRWQHYGRSQPTADGGPLLIDDTTDEPAVLSRVEPDTGRVLWSVPIPPPSNAAYQVHDGRVDRFVLVQPTGEVQVHDAGSGDLLRSVDTLPGDRSAFQRVQVVDDLLLLVPPGGTRLLGYGLPDLSPRWAADVPLVSYVIGCAGLLCALQQTGGLQVLDPASGAVRWSDPGLDTLTDVRRGRMLVAGPNQRYAARDAATGQARAELGQWNLVPTLRPDDPLVGVRPVRDGRLVVAELDLVAGRSRIIDVLPDVVGNCQASLPILLCQRLDGSTALWRLPE